ncbi:hypothetical protein THAOC_02245 [Thalassiosira oceanica]|uniref:Uncharacterized protein n=1 Tax=Thalassiosira oceanica TaxID=159749 RepID=K0TF17_THAOC|nr:hypothetical protein THAOC_02245 [Thalassiosira oceanica]|mmetsp:Transcript_19104/g.44731  ORF Transcript_19104/g.44731 Transcript_19104/m.44731 type:complete len:444 (-) Transcript_19104:157-1488(-)|eukprot:EJK76010.1 hypothetical protein THAOC_02245 [Thalassiosira oceanica]
MMFKLLAVTALSSVSASAKVSPEMQGNLEKIQRDGVAADSSFGRHLLAKSRQLDESSNYSDMTFVSGYSIKFLGCHHVTQWDEDESAWYDNQSYEEAQEGNNNNEENNYNKPYISAANGRLTQKGLIRFRLCKSDSCFDHFNNGCSSNYGEYVVDMSTFLDAYIGFQVQQVQEKCSKYQSKCSTKCSDASNSASCYSKCYSGYNLNAALCSSANDQYSQYNANNANNGSSEYGFDLQSYLSCSQYSVYDASGDQISSYLGPYCADQGGDIRLGFFSDKYCLNPSTYQASYFEKLTGVEVPYTKSSIVSTKCISCESTYSENAANNQADYYNYDQDGNKNYYDTSTVNSMCASTYLAAGKCETQMTQGDNPYPEEGACTYIEGVKRLKGDGIIRSDQNIRSRPASIVIGVFTSLAVLLGGYVYYLKTQISRSRVNLAGATTSLA